MHANTTIFHVYFFHDLSHRDQAPISRLFSRREFVWARVVIHSAAQCGLCWETLYQSDGEHWWGFWLRQAHYFQENVEYHINRLAQDYNNSSIPIMELLQSCTKPLICFFDNVVLHIDDQLHEMKDHLIPSNVISLIWLISQSDNFVTQTEREAQFSYFFSFVLKPEMPIYLCYKYECMNILFTMCPPLLTHCGPAPPYGITDWTKSSFVQVMASHLFSAESLSKPLLIYWR